MHRRGGPFKVDGRGAGYNIVDLFCDTGLAPTKSEARRLVQQGGAFVSSGGGMEAVNNIAAVIGADRLNAEGELVLRAGKKRYCLAVTENRSVFAGVLP
jgi:tyrosyl-tRNA synthetase